MNNQSQVNLDYSSDNHGYSLLKQEEKKEPDLLKEEIDDFSEQNEPTWENISTYKQIKGLAQLNKNLGRVSQKFANQPELNGLFLIGSVTSNFTQVIDPLLSARENQLDKQGAGVALIRRLSEIVPERFVGDSQEPFIWNDPEQKGKTYQFEVAGGLVTENGKTKFTPRTLKAIDLSSDSEAFQAISLDNRSWRIEKCDFTRSQLLGLSKAQNLANEEQKQENSASRQPQNIQLER